ncbi:hypothetical protein D9M69_688620 [compost metagenome]
MPESAVTITGIRISTFLYIGGKGNWCIGHEEPIVLRSDEDGPFVPGTQGLDV